ncbi:MAG: hypothetical protein JST54_33380 [Deltaproteobacteria bacterium]|nr:hypothetical protein [Deltaproteobacteria bacterium]
MAAAIDFRTTEHLPPPVDMPALDLSRALCTRAEAIAQAWRRELYGNAQDPLASLGQLDDVVAPLVAELGRSLATPSDLPAAPFGRATGVLRLSMTRGPAGLFQEFGLLRTLLEQAASQVGASMPERRRLRVLLDAAQAQALALLRQRVMPHLPHADVPFAGIVLEMA